MPKAGTFTVGWNRDLLQTLRMFEAAVSGELEAALRAGVKKAVQYVHGEVVRRIRDGKYQRLGQLTLALRGAEGLGTTPLLAHGSLIRGISTDVLADDEGVVGVLRKLKSRRRDPKTGRFATASDVNVAEIVHEGLTIRVTERMRQAFARRIDLLQQRQLIGSYNGRGVGVIRIPPRPFLREVFEDPRVTARVGELLTEALREKVRLLK